MPKHGTCIRSIYQKENRVSLLAFLTLEPTKYQKFVYNMKSM